MSLFKIIITITIMALTMIIIVITIIISTTTFQYITEKLEKMTLLFSQFWGFYCRPRCFILPNSKKRCNKITADHK